MQERLPILFLNDIVLFPNQEIRLEFDDEKTKEIISLAESYYEKRLLIINTNKEINNIEDIPKIGVSGYITMRLDLPNSKTRIAIKGLNRNEIKETTSEEGIILADSKEIENTNLSPVEEMAYSRSLFKQIEFFIENNPNASNNILTSIMGINDINKLTDILVSYIPITHEKALEYINETDPTNRVLMLIEDINNEIQVTELEAQIDDKVTKDLDKSQREYLLKEKIKAIKEELGSEYDKDEEILSIKLKIEKLGLNSKTKQKILKELSKYESLNPVSPEVGMVKGYIDTFLSLPWNKKTKDNKDLIKAEEYLNETHFGLHEVKARMIEHLALSQLTGSNSPSVICLVGPPGVGKTTFAMSVAKAMNKKYVKISVGGITDEADIIGHRRTYIGASPGKIISGIEKAGSINPVFVIDEIDKIVKDNKKDPSSCLLEVLDKEQNNKFCDNYIEEEFDLSNVLFICTANYKEQIPYELYDRLEIIELSSYTEEEKINICKNYIIPKGITSHGLKKEYIIFTDDAIKKIIRNYTKEAGVRELERTVFSILRKIVKGIVVNKDLKLNIIDDGAVTKYLGKEKYLVNMDSKRSFIGITNGMSYNILGGDLLKIEVNYFKGSGNIIMTGSLGDIFIESAKIALSYIKSNYKKFKIDYDLLLNNDIHIHVPEGAIKKDGPSAGIAITTAIISALTNIKVSSAITMTGEITLRGNILPVGGLKEKILGAKRKGVHKIYLPADNKNDIEEIEDYIKEGLHFYYLNNYNELYEEIFKKKK